MAQSKFYGSLILATPVCETGGGDYSLVSDATQKQWPLGGIYMYPDSSGRPRIIKYVQYNPTGTASVGPIASFVAAATAGGSGYVSADIGKAVTVTTGGIGAYATIASLTGDAVATFAVAPAVPGTGYTTGAGKATGASPGGGSGATIEIKTLAGWQQGSPLYYKDETRTVVTNLVTESATYLASARSPLWSFAGIGINPTSPPIGGYCFVQIGGFCDKVLMPASTVAGDILVLTNTAAATPTDNILIRVAAATLLTVFESITACVFLTTVAAAAGGFGHGWIQAPCSPV